MSGAPQAGDRGRRVVELSELLAAGGSGAPDPVADLGGAAGTAEEHAVADFRGIDRYEIESESEGAGGTDSSTSAAGAGADAPVAALDGLGGGGSVAAPVAGLDGDALGATATAGRTADLGAAGARRRRPAGSGDSDRDDRERRRPSGRGGSAGGRVARRSDDPAERGSGDDAAKRDPGSHSPVRGSWSDSGELGSGSDAAEPGTDSGPGTARTRGRRGGRGSREERSSARTAAVEADPVAAARDICLRLLSDRARTRHELAQALHRKEIPDDVAEQVLGRFDEVGLIDDAAFAGQWVRSRHRSRGLGRRAIAQELRRKGVDDEIAGEALAEVDDAAEEGRARELVDKKLRTLRISTPEERTVAIRRLAGMLGRRGYPSGVAYGVVRAALAEHGAETEDLDGGEPLD